MRLQDDEGKGGNNQSEKDDDFTLSKTDREAQFAFCKLSGLVEHALGPRLVEQDWCDILQNKYASMTLTHVTELIITAKSGKVKAKRRRGWVLVDMVQETEIGQQEYTDAQEGNGKNTRERHRRMWRTKERK